MAGAPVKPLFSVVVPMRDEADNAVQLVEEIVASCSPVGPFEIWLVDDGSNDGTGGVVRRLQQHYPMLNMIRHTQSAGQSAAIHNGVLQARAPVVCTLDGDGQNPPDQIPHLLKPLLARGADPALKLVAGQRVGRQDTFARRFASKFANALRSSILNDDTRDTGCGLKAFDREAFLALPYFNHMHRFLPALFRRDGWTVVHVDVTHRPRTAGRSKYNNFNRAIVGISDLCGVAWLVRRRKNAAARQFVKICGD